MRIRRLLTILCAVARFSTAHPAQAADPGWSYYGGDQGGQRFSAARQITPTNVASLAQAWSFSTGDMATKGEAMQRASFENTPILADGRLYVCSPFNEVSAIDPGTGRQIWRFDPKLDTSILYPNDYTCRGVAYWRNPNGRVAPVRRASISPPSTAA